MAEYPPAFPYFIAVEPRALSEAERTLTERMLRDLNPKYKAQLAKLLVVGRCGCGHCPTIFFQPHQQGETEHDLVAFAGPDASGGMTGAVLMEKNGVLSQLDFYSIDAHEPLSMPLLETLEQYN